MRLDETEKKALNTALQDIEAEVYLFGSRVDDYARGGDIDLLIYSTSDPYHLAQDITVRFQMECDEKIDILVLDPGNITEEQQAFVRTLNLERIK